MRFRKKALTVLLTLVLMASFSGCTQGAMVDGEYVSSYGFLNSGDKVENVNYEISISNAIITVIFSETIVIPILYFASYIYVPVN